MQDIVFQVFLLSGINSVRFLPSRIKCSSIKEYEVVYCLSCKSSRLVKFVLVCEPMKSSRIFLSSCEKPQRKGGSLFMDNV